MISKKYWEINILFYILSGDFMSYVDQFGDFMSGDFMSGDFLTGYQLTDVVWPQIINDRHFDFPAVLIGNDNGGHISAETMVCCYL